jgi:hypothetical protein
VITPGEPIVVVIGASLAGLSLPPPQLPLMPGP